MSGKYGNPKPNRKPKISQALVSGTKTSLGFIEKVSKCKLKGKAMKRGRTGQAWVVL